MTREELLTKAKPILFNTEMVQAILAGRKTVTRRVIKPKHKGASGIKIMSGYVYDIIPIDFIDGQTHTKEYQRAPFKAGDYLYVRETWQYLYELDGNEQIIEGTDRYYYKATDTIPFDTYVDSMGITHETVPWKPSIHMPKEAARIFLKVTDVRVERLQDITEEQAKTEGSNVGISWTEKLEHSSIERFEKIWNSTIKKSDIDKYGWEANPWVFVVEFTKIDITEK